jgi:V8-like Glu-specific endopeptidase
MHTPNSDHPDIEAIADTRKDPSTTAFIRPKEPPRGVETPFDENPAKPVNSPEKYPWSAICSLIAYDNSDTPTEYGTGWFVSSRTIVTAAHCVFGESLRGKAKRVEVLPDRATSLPILKSVRLDVPIEWERSALEEHDYAVIQIDGIDGRKITPLEMKVPDIVAGLKIEIVGYPNDSKYRSRGSSDKQWRAQGDIQSISTTTQIFHNASTYEGQSGSPVLVGSGTPSIQVIGIHTYGTNRGPGASYNRATRLTKEVHKWIMDRRS